MKWFVLAFAFVSPLLAHGQTLRFATPFPLTIPASTNLKFAGYNPQGNLVIVGTRTQTSGAPAFLRRLDAQGNVLSEQTVTPLGESFANLIDVEMDSSGALSMLFQGGTGLSVSRLAWNGVLVSSFRAPATFFAQELPVALNTVGTSGVVVLSEVRSGSGPRNPRIRRINAAGVAVWDVSFDGDPAFDEYPVAMDLDSNSVYVALSRSGPNPNSSRGSCLALDIANGSTRWQATYSSGLPSSFDTAQNVAAPRGSRTRVALLVRYQTTDFANAGVAALFLDPANGANLAQTQVGASSDTTVLDTAFGPAEGLVGFLYTLGSDRRVTTMGESGGVPNTMVPSLPSRIPERLAFYGTDASNDRLVVGMAALPGTSLNPRLWTATPTGGSISSRSIGLRTTFTHDFRQIVQRSDGGVFALIGNREREDPASVLQGIAVGVSNTAVVETVDLVEGTAQPRQTSSIAATDAAGNAYLATHSDSEGQGAQYYASELVKQSPAGTILWRRPLGAPNPFLVRQIIVRPDGDLVISGDNGFSILLIARVNGATGALRWRRSVPNVGIGTDVNFASHARNGDILLAGRIFRSAGSADSWVGRLSGVTGALLWSRIFDYPNRGSDSASGVVELSGGNLVVYGSGASGSGTAPFAAWLRPNGSPIRRTIFDGSQSEFEQALPDGSNRVILAGNWLGGTGGSSDLEARQFDANGNPTWPAPFRYNFADRSEEFRDAVVDAGGNLIMVGLSQTAAVVQQAVIVRVRANGTRDWVGRYASGPDRSDNFDYVALGAGGRIWVAGNGFSLPEFRTRAYLTSYSPTGVRGAVTNWTPNPNALTVYPFGLGWSAPNRLTVFADGPIMTPNLGGAPVVPYILRYDAP